MFWRLELNTKGYLDSGFVCHDIKNYEDLIILHILLGIIQ